MEVVYKSIKLLKIMFSLFSSKLSLNGNTSFDALLNWAKERLRKNAGALS
jgi:hypothetical protein